MPFSDKYHLPSDEELTVPEIQITSAALKAAGTHMGKYCDNPCKVWALYLKTHWNYWKGHCFGIAFWVQEFMLCKKEYLGDPRPCVNEGKEVTRCSLEFLKKVKKTCGESFEDYWRCLDVKFGLKFRHCRDYQKLFDECMEEKLGQPRPEIHHFSKIRLHETTRPKLPKPEMPERLIEYNEAEAVPRTKTFPAHSFSR